MKRFDSDTSDRPHPEDFPLGSLESRVAARALAEHKNEPERRIVIRFGDGRVDVEPPIVLADGCVLRGGNDK